MNTRACAVFCLGLLLESVFGCGRADVPAQAVIAVAEIVNEKPEAVPADAKPALLTITSELSQNQIDQSVDIEFHLRGGGLRADTQVATVKLFHMPGEMDREVQVTLKQGYAYRYKIEAKTNLRDKVLRGMGIGSYTGTITFTEGESKLRLVSDFTGSRSQPDGRGSFTVNYKPFLAVASSTATFAAASAPPVLKLISPEPLKTSVKAWVEVDGEKLADWPNDALEIDIPLTAGEHAVTVRSTEGKLAYRNEFKILMPEKGVIRRRIEGMKPDPKKGK